MANNREYVIKISPVAASRLVEYAKYIATASETAAYRLIDEFEKSVDTLKQMPERCPFLLNPMIQDQKYRKLLFEKHYLILYQIKGDCVYIETVVDAKQDYHWLIP